MKLINNTRIPDDTLLPLLLKAGRSVGARTAGVVVQVNLAPRCVTSRGRAYPYDWVRWIRGSNRRMKTDHGAFRISLPVRTITERSYIVAYRNKAYDALEVAQHFFYVARHEWGHIRDFQTGDYWKLGHSSKMTHDRRPQELRAENYIYEADERKRGEPWAYEENMALALALENVC